MTAKTEGWTWLHNAMKWHYFVEGRSLCNRWMLWSSSPEDLDPEMKASPDNCKACWRAVEWRRAKAEVAHA